MLEHLPCSSGPLERRPYQNNPPRFEYLLTEAGRDLRPVILTLMAWGAKHAAGSQKVYRQGNTLASPFPTQASSED